MDAFQSVDCGNHIETMPAAPTDCNGDLCSRTHTGAAGDVCADCAEILHGLNNALASMLLNAQVMEWKLPSYSRSRRYLHEIERNAQRGGELVKRMLGRLEARCPAAMSECQAGTKGPTSTGEDHATAPLERDATTLPAAVPLRSATHPASLFLSQRKKVPHTRV